MARLQRPKGVPSDLWRGTNALKCWEVLACGTTSERPLWGYSRRATACLQVRWLQELKSSTVWVSTLVRLAVHVGLCRRTVS